MKAWDYFADGEIDPGGSFTGPKQWLSLHIGQGACLTLIPFLHLSAHSCFLTVHVKWTSSPWSILEVWYKIENLVQIFIPAFFFFFFWLLLQSAQGFSSLTSLRRPMFPLTVLICDSCWEPLCDGIVRLPCPLNPQSFFLNCQLHQLVPHVVWVCTVAAVAKSLKCGQNANWSIDKF